ncbi:tetratricopeptide repeat-containing serine protease family protein [Prevotella sp. AGR2160]|uniref:tetratricopeptide repeat-containing S1 family peptidase n=1 Tax=Prevotella sp. AGR2160 TaxID=1280674 RepID=UPI0004111A4D|nr:tetratricopeptide repeat-containing serine protease family protein [Prevotella sp. AGR2160]
MKKQNIIWAALLLLAMPAFSQNAAVQKAAKAVFTLKTFNHGQSLMTCQGVFIDNKGTALTAFTPFDGADSAVVVDAFGKTRAVDYIMGADENYDVAKLKIEGSSTGVALASSVSGGCTLWLVSASTGKTASQKLTVDHVEPFDNHYSYAITKYVVGDADLAAPVVNGGGQLVGLIKGLPSGTESGITDGRFVNSLHMDALSIQKLSHTGIRTGLPDDENAAEATLMLARSTRSKADNYKYAREFIEKFPTSATGYQALAELDCNAGKFADADKELQLGVTKAAKKDEAYSNYAQQVYQYVAFTPQGGYTPWTADKALELAQKANSIAPNPAYQHQIAQVTYLKGDYQKAYDSFQALTKTNINNGELWYESAQCKMQLKAPESEVKALLDSAVSVGQQKGIVAPYYLVRGQWLQSKEDYRNALKDYIAYDTLSTRVDPTFYHAKYECEMKLHQWQPALLDIMRCSYLSPREPLYLAQWASLELLVNRLPQAIQVATACTKAAPDFAQGYLILGIAQCENKQKEEGLRNLQKAKELGETRAGEYLKKFQ